MHPLTADSDHRVHPAHGLLHLPHHRLPARPRSLIHHLQASSRQHAQEIPLIILISNLRHLYQKTLPSIIHLLYRRYILV